MAYTRINPYIALEELREELKMSVDDIPAGSTVEDDLLRAIDNASRWVDDYTHRDYFFHDHTVTPMLFDQFDDGVYGRLIFPRATPVIAVASIKLNGEVVDADKYVVKQMDDAQKIVALFGDWFRTNQAWSGTTNRQTIEVFGSFGYAQNTAYAITVAGDVAGQLSGFSLSGTVPATLYWKLSSPDTDVALLQLYSDSGMTALVAEGKTAALGTAINLWPMNGSGISGTGNIAFTTADGDVANTFTRGAATYSASAVPTGLPLKIKLATRLVAAALSGRNRKEIVDVTGAKQTIATSSIPKTVFDLLGRRSPILT